MLARRTAFVHRELEGPRRRVGINPQISKVRPACLISSVSQKFLISMKITPDSRLSPRDSENVKNLTKKSVHQL